MMSYCPPPVAVSDVTCSRRTPSSSDTQFSLLHGLAFSLFYAFMGMPIAYLADRFSRPKIIAVGVVFWSLTTAACGLSKNFLHMFLARIGVGVGEAALSPSAYSMFSDMFPKEKLGRAVGIYSIGSFIGGGLAFLVGGYVIAMLKDMNTIEVAFLGAMKAWQLAFFIVGLPGILVGLLIWLAFAVLDVYLISSEERWWMLANPSYGGWEPAQFNNAWDQPAGARRESKRSALELAN